VKLFTYAGAMLPNTPSNKFLTSVYKNSDGKTFIQSKNEAGMRVFKAFNPSRPLITPNRTIEIAEGEEPVYSFITSNNNFYSGQRVEMEKNLLPLLYDEDLNVHSKLMISSFLKLFQKTLDLIEDSNKDLLEKGIEDKISVTLPFSTSQEINIDGTEFRVMMLNRLSTFRQTDKRIRAQDIMYLKDEKAFFDNFQVHMDVVINRDVIGNRDQSLVICRMIVACSKDNPNLLHSMITGYAGTLEFILQSKILLLPQHEVESLISEKASEQILTDDESVLKIGIDVDKEIYEIGVSQLGSLPVNTRLPNIRLSTEQTISDADFSQIYRRVTKSELTTS
jgi:hypothetical protein